ncbi:phosphoribosyltransferase family protein [Paramuribaculum intestinale]|jgi:ComF family protein|uniref:ComF family protein n=1 Tax=Paramuribaculum intestinale TaxID=2094151 RepID=A0A2V1J1Q2_9BACT|nr:phosphoribosyltransferase family protein [Paramuribaculum intestinale]MBJ2185276.1 ComF family protein [Muribaculaceae bacterium]ROS92837.1 ComF family protein [Muribaculaceae bacterium Isolate-043 (Harlan)]MCX4329746.1 phosphoribosyltransferase family protein [Paramuribaculum intestinale]PWB08901.1 ComF family protein [Paramuribaculum intestinale]PWB11441.1 ComF family protein [Paramuribaculum intestinale]
MKQSIRSWIDDLASVIFPRVCEVCGRSLAHGEHILCLECLTDMPRTGIASDAFTQMHIRLASPGLPVEKAASWFYYYRDSPYAKLIQQAKYNGRPRLARTLGRMFATEIAPTGFFDGIDVITPVPLATLKFIIRGYNQAKEIALGISDATGLPVEEMLHARRHSTQTRRTSYQRWINTRGVYTVSKHHTPDSRHILLVDDVMTTGATTLSCLTALHTASPAARISVATLALAHKY